MSKARPQSEPRQALRGFNVNPFRRKNNRKTTRGRHNQHIFGMKVINHTAY